ncbi:MAG: hypothetical protein V1729_05320 [Candidatus Woesearchaeota archaeon]
MIMIRYSLGQDMVFIILALISAFALLSKNSVLAIAFFALAMIFVLVEDKITEYIRSA